MQSRLFFFWWKFFLFLFTLELSVSFRHTLASSEGEIRDGIWTLFNAYDTLLTLSTVKSELKCTFPRNFSTNFDADSCSNDFKSTKRRSMKKKKYFSQTQRKIHSVGQQLTRARTVVMSYEFFRKFSENFCLEISRFVEKS